MKPREIVVDLVKAAFVVLIVKVTASSSMLIPWNATIDNLCIAFALCVTFAKLCRLTLPLRHLLVLGIMALVSLYTCVSMGQYDLLVTVIAVCLLIDVDLEGYISLMLKIQAYLILAHIAAAGFLTLIRDGNAYWIWTDHRLRFNAGFVHPNVLSCYILSCMLMFAWKQFRRITANQFGWMVLITVLTFAMTRSRTGLLLNLFLLLLLFLTQNEHALVVKLLNPILLVLFPGLTALFFWAQKHFVSGSSIALLLDDLMTGRIKYAAYAYLRSGTSLLPRYLDYAYYGVVSWSPEWNLNTFTFDNLYSYMFIQMGIIWIGITTMLIIFVCRRFDFRNKIFVLMWILYAIVEVHGLNCFKFFPLLLLSTLFSGEAPAPQQQITNQNQ